MRYLFYTNYRSGNAGLSNGIMSIEIGVILAHLTNRMLVLDGNRSPPANIVAYDGRVDNREGSRVTDLIDIPVPWAEPDAVELDGSREPRAHRPARSASSRSISRRRSTCRATTRAASPAAASTG